MKNFMRTLLVAALVFAAAGAARLRAEEDGGHKHGKEGRQAMFMARGEKLGLTDAQTEKMKAAAKANWEAVKPLRRELRDENIKLRDQLEDKADAKQVTQTLDRIEATRRKMAEGKQKFHSAMASILDPMQRARMELLLQERMRRGGWGERQGGAGGGWRRGHGKKGKHAECALESRAGKKDHDSWHPREDASPAKDAPQPGEKEETSDPAN